MSDSTFPHRTYKAGQIIFREGQRADCMYVVRTGKVELYLDEPEGKKSLAVIGVHGLFGEMGLIDNKPRSAHAVALEETDCLVFMKADLDKRMEKLDPFMQALIKVLVNTVRTSNKTKLK